MINPMPRCAHCRRLFCVNPRVKNQLFCSRKACQAARKNRWLQKKLATDGDYRAMKKECQQDWVRRHPDYWRLYRRRQRQSREAKHRPPARRQGGVLAQPVKKDALASFNNVKPGRYYLVPCIGPNPVKKDALMVDISVITG